MAGTPLTMAPEAIVDPARVDPRADLCAVGAVGYFLPTGGHVFTGTTPIDLCMHHLQTPPTPPSERLGRPVDPDLEALVLRCLAKDPADRPASAADIAKDLAASALPWTRADATTWWAARPRPDPLATAPTDRLGALGAMTVAVPRSR